jgi:hypothetical protein
METKATLVLLGLKVTLVLPEPREIPETKVIPELPGPRAIPEPTEIKETLVLESREILEKTALFLARKETLELRAIPGIKEIPGPTQQ